MYIHAQKHRKSVCVGWEAGEWLQRGSNIVYTRYVHIIFFLIYFLKCPEVSTPACPESEWKSSTK